MKKIGILALTLTLLFCLSGCNVFNVTNQILGSNQVDSDAADKDVESGKISLGEVENHTYRNDSFGISCTLTDEWVFLSREEILSVNSLSAELMGDELAQQIADAPILYDMTANNPVTGAGITVNMEKITILQAATLDLKATLESQFEGIRTGLSNIGYADVTITYENLQVSYEVEILAGIPGDLDENLTVDKEDVMQLLWHVSFPELYPVDTVTDFTGDGITDKEDVMHLLWHVSFPDLYPL